MNVNPVSVAHRATHRTPLRFALPIVCLLFAVACNRPQPPAAPAASGTPDINLAGVESAADANLFRAAGYETPDAVALRIEQGAKVDATNNLGRTPIFAAAFHGRADTAKALLDKGASLAVHDSSGLTPLHAAVLGGNAGVVSLFLAAGADVNARSVAEMTPLHMAAATGQIDLAKQLLAAGADRTARDRQGETAARLAETNHHPATLALLQKPKPHGPR